jgi:pilus assembly protein CpaB
VAGFIHPGDHVDVLMEMAKPGSTDHFSKTILQNIVVLSAGPTWEQGRDEKPAVVNTVTLVLTTAQAEILNLASDQGKIRLALRNRTDLAEQTTRGVDTSNLLGSDSEKKEAPKGATPNQKNVEMIKGLARSRVNL